MCLLLPGGIKQLFTSDDTLKNKNNYSLLDAYDSYKSGTVSKSEATNAPLDSVEKIIQYYDQADEKAIQFVRDVEDGNVKLKEGETIVKAFTTKYSSGIKQLGSNILSLGKNIAKTFGKAALSAGIMWLVSEGIGLVVKAGKYIYDEWLTDNGKNKRRNEAVSKTSELISSNKEEISAIDEYSSKIEELGKKLDDASTSVSEMVEIKGELLTIQNNIKDTYGKEAEGIDLVNGKYDEEIAKLEEIERKKSKDFLYGDKGVLSKTDKDGKTNFEKNLEVEFATINGKNTQRTINGLSEDTYNKIAEILNQGEFEGLSFDRIIDQNGTHVWDVFDVEEGITKEKANELLTNFYAELDKQYGTNEEVQQFKKDLQENIKIGYNSSKATTASGNNEYAIEALLASGDKENIIEDLRTATDDYNKALTEYETNKTDETYEKYEEAKKNLEEIKYSAEHLAQYDPGSAETLGAYNHAMDKYYEMVEAEEARQSKTIDERYANKFQNADSELRALGDKAKSILDEDEFKFLESLLPDDVAALTLDDLKKLIDEAKRMAEEADIKLEIKPEASDLVEDLDTFEDKMSSINTVYESAVTNKETPSASDVQGVTSGLGGIGKDSEGEYNAMSSALEKYNKQLVENKGDVAVAQTATDELTTAYLDLSGTLEDTIDEYGDYAAEILKAQGIENAEAVVQSRLNKTYKATRANLVAVAKAVAEYGDQFENSVEGSKDYEDAIEKILPSVKKLVGLYNQDTGELVAEADIDGQFLADNWDLVKDSINGVDGALDELYVKIALLNAQKVLVKAGVDGTQLDADLANISDLLSIASTWTMEPEALLKNEQFMSALKACWDGSEQTANAINAALSTIGMKVEYKKTAKKLRVAATGNKGGQTVYGGENAGKVVSMEEVEVDDFEIVSTPTGKGSSGTGAKVGGSGSSGGSNGGGDGGNSGNNDKATEDTEETFDWIEVYIQRIEEEISRLDKVIDNVYEKWGERNDKISEKIGKLKEEITGQERAYEEYLRNARELKVNDGKDLNWEDYGDDETTAKASKQYEYDQKQLTEAKRAWAEDGYIDKIKKGLISGEDIQKIQNKYLVEIIQKYQEWYNKAVAAKDTIADLNIQISDSYKQLFENIISDYDDVTDNISKQSDIINERISRTQEHGFFVDKSYYEDLITNEKTTQGKLIEERKKLIDQFNAGLDSGYIKPYTEAWWDMYQQIQDVNQAIEQSYTEVVKLNNEIRQLEWDRFDWIEERMADVSNEADWLIGLLQGENNYDDKGYYNNRGFAQAGLVGAKYEDAVRRAERYKNEITKINDEIAKNGDKTDQNLIARKEELVQAYRDAISAAEEEKKAMQSLVQEGINKHLEALQEVIDKYKEQLNVEKD